MPGTGRIPTRKVFTPMSLLKRSALVAATVAGLTLALAAPAAAHVTVNPDTATPGGYTKVTFRVPNESDTASTTKVEVNLPANAPVASVSVKPVPGWDAVAVKSKLQTPIESHGTQITEAVSKITWTAQAAAAVKPGQFQEFDVSLGPLPETNQMVFKTLQTYSDGSVVRWIEEPAADGAELENPAPVLKLAAAPASAATAPAASAETTDTAEGTDTLGIAGLIAGVLALILALLAYARASRHPEPATTLAKPATPARPAAPAEPTAPAEPATTLATPAAGTSAKSATDTTAKPTPAADEETADEKDEKSAEPKARS
jgi:uncharacterized protein YcnI